jgi:N-acylneuraminate-9-phosphatase
MDLARDLQNCFDRERLQGFRWTTGVEWLVRTLYGQGIKVGIITNGHAQVQRAKLKACNAEELFDTILVGGEEPDMKPHRDIFIKACNLAGCKPEESIMVGDTIKTDIQGGINAGFLATVWVNVHQREPHPGSAKPDHEITTFIELQHVLEQYGVVFGKP